MNRLRAWLPLLYLLATVVAQSSHDHEWDSRGKAAHEAGCADPRPHIAGHWSPDLSGDHDHCVACQHRADHQGWILKPFNLDRPISSSLIEIALPSTPNTSARWNPCRGPPERATA